MKYEREDSVAEAMYDIKEMLPEGITLIGLAVMHGDILGDANARYKEASDRSRVHFENRRVKAQKEKMQ